jgi:hypothetical protein
MSDPVIVEVPVAAPVEVVWRALRDSDEIRRWFGWDYEGLEAEIKAIFLSDAAVASEADRTLETEGGGGRFELEPRGESETVVRVARPAPAGQATWDGIYDEINEGWLTFVQQLRFALERHPGEDRRAVYLDGATALEAVGVDAAVGARFQTAAAATPLTGEVRFRSPRQLGLTVDEWNDGLLILTTQSPSGQALLTTYGLDAAAFEDLRTRWTDWWEAHGR